VRKCSWLYPYWSRLLARGRRGSQLIIDLGGVTFLDCAGLNVLVATRRRAQLEGGWVHLVRVPPQARRMISLLKLDGAFGLGTLGSVA
jgi:anti-sigma B factor antagonist